METAKLKIVNVPLEEITPYENNPRVNEVAVDQLAKIIAEFGFRNPAVLNKDKVIVEGHTRLLALKKLGWATMPCIIATDLTPEQEKALRIADKGGESSASLRKSIVSLLVDCYRQINAANRIKHSETTEQVVQDINGVIAHYKLVAKKPHSQQDAPEPDPDPQPETDGSSEPVENAV